MSLVKLNLDGASDVVVSVSAVTKAQQANATILFGKNATVIVKRLDELNKVKELDTAKLRAILDVLSDEAATTALAKKAAGKNLVTAVKNLYKAKTLVATINALRAIRIKVNATNELSAKIKPTKVAKTKGTTEAASVVATRVDTNAELPAVNLARVTPLFMFTVSQGQIDSMAAQISKATGLTFVGVHSPTNGQSSDWTFQAQVNSKEYVNVHIDPPFEYHEYQRSSEWSVSGKTKDGRYGFGHPLKRPTVETLAKEVRSLIGSKATNKADTKGESKKVADFKYTAKDLLVMTQAQRVKTTAELAAALGTSADLTYGIDTNGEPLSSAKKGDSWYIEGAYGNEAIYISFDDVDEGREYRNKWRVTAGLSSGNMDEKTFAVGDIAGIKKFLEKYK